MNVTLRRCLVLVALLALLVSGTALGQFHHCCSGQVHCFSECTNGCQLNYEEGDFCVYMTGGCYSMGGCPCCEFPMGGY